MGPLTWPAEVLEYIARTNRKPDYTAPALERRARRQADDLVPVLERIGFWPRSWLDIGCGLACLDVFLAHRFGPPMTVHLLDAQEQGTRRNSYNTEADAWNEVDPAVTMFRANITDTRIGVVAHYAGADFAMPRVDMVLSSRSWGHHYPIATYARAVAKRLAPGGVIVTDIRRKTDGRQVLERAGFEAIEQVPDPSGKCERWVFARKGEK